MYPEGFCVVEAITAHSESVSSLQDFPKYLWEADSTPRVFCPKLMAFIYRSRTSSFEKCLDTSRARYCSCSLRLIILIIFPPSSVQEVKTVFFRSCWVMVLAPCFSLPRVMRNSHPDRAMPWMSTPLC